MSTSDQFAAADVALRADLAFVRRLALALAGPRDADDLAQDVACALLERGRAARIEGVPPPARRAWLAAITRHLQVDRLRAGRARAAREQACAGGLRDADPSEVVARGEWHRHVLDAVLALAEPYRSTILLRYLDELSCADVAARTGVPEATVRKRVERGLRLLRARLAGQADLRPALAPLLAWRVPTLAGALLMKAKLFAAVALLMVVGLAWLYLAPAPDSAVVEVGGQGVVVSEAEANARAREGAVGRSGLASGERTPAPGSIAAAPAAGPRVSGRVFVDGAPACPADLRIETSGQSRPSVDAVVGHWQLVCHAADAQVTLWVTSRATVPAQIPVPDDLLARGGGFDLHLRSGRTLTLTFLDADSGQPLDGLDFELTRGLELLRTRGQVHHRAAETMHRTDAEGRAVVQGLAMRGYVRVVVDCVRRERHIVMRDGSTVQTRWPGHAVWELSLDDASPSALEHTLRVRRPRGEARARGQLPAWLAPTDRAQARPVAREVVDDRSRGDAFAVPVSAEGHFELVVSAPSRYAIWLERRADRAPLSATVELEFSAGGEELAIAFAPLRRSVVELVCANVPPTGQVTCTARSGPTGVPIVQSAPCRGQPLALRIEVAGDEPLTVRVDADAQPGKWGWSRRIDSAEWATGRVQLDLSGALRTLALEGLEPPLAGEGALLLTPVRGTGIDLRERVVVWCEAGRAVQAVHVPPGRWLYHHQGDGARAVFGVVTMASGERGPLPLAVRLERVAAPERALRFEQIDGVSLDGYPEALRVFAPPPAEFVWLPADCRTTPVDRARR